MRIDKEVITVLASSDVEGNELRLNSQLDRAMYQKVNKVLKAIGGKWNSAKKKHIFQGPVEDLIQEIILTGEFVSEKKTYQFFPTPPELAAKLVEMANVSEHDICLEPSAGRGNIAKYLPNCDCIELNEANRKYLTENGFNVVHDDFMTFEPDKDYDVIVMNPPFCKQQDIQHITKAISIAKKTVIAVASQSVMFRTDKKSSSFRALVASLNGTITELPANSFKDSGTVVNTCIVKIKKR